MPNNEQATQPTAGAMRDFPFTSFRHEMSETENRGDNYICAALYGKHLTLGEVHVGQVALSLHPCAGPEETEHHRELVEDVAKHLTANANANDALRLLAEIVRQETNLREQHRGAMDTRLYFDSCAVLARHAKQ